MQLLIGHDTYYTISDPVDVWAKTTSIKRFYPEWQACNRRDVAEADFNCGRLKGPCSRSDGENSIWFTVLLSQDRVYAACRDCTALRSAA
jgi:hypothetical protein